MYRPGHEQLCVCVSVCLSAAACPHCYTDPGVTWRNGRGCPSCALLGRFAIGARVALLWQHSANVKYQRVLVSLYAWLLVVICHVIVQICTCTMSDVPLVLRWCGRLQNVEAMLLDACAAHHRTRYERSFKVRSHRMPHRDATQRTAFSVKL